MTGTTMLCTVCRASPSFPIISNDYALLQIIMSAQPHHTTMCASSVSNVSVRYNPPSIDAYHNFLQTDMQQTCTWHETEPITIHKFHLVNI